jgi:hypothetical protein
LLHLPLAPPIPPLTMAHGGSFRRNIGNHFHSSGSCLITTAEDSTKAYHAHTPPKIRKKIDLDEADVRVLRHFILYVEVVNNIHS